MVNEFKNLILAGIGSAATTYEKASKLVDELVEKGKLTLEEGKELSEELKRNIKDKKEEFTPLTKEDLISVLKNMDFASKEDFESLKEKIHILEDKINKKP